MNNKVDKSLDSQDSVVIAEYRLLNAIYLNKNALSDSGVSKDLLIHEVCKTIYDVIEQLYQQNIPISENAVYQRASGLNINVTIDSIKTIANINKDPNVCTKDIVSLLYDTKQSLSAISDMREVESEIHSNPIRTPESDDKIRQKLYEIEGKLLSSIGVKRVENFDELTTDYLDIFESRKNGKKYLFNDPILDKAITCGPAPGCGGMIAAATGMGKSAFCLNLINRFINLGTPVMYYSLEMGKADTMDRLIALRKQLPLSDIINPPDTDTWQVLKKEIQQECEILKQNKNFRFSECASISLPQVKQDITKFQTDIGQQYCIVVFDLLSIVKEFMVTDKSGVNFAQGIEVAINVLNAMAKELGFHYIAVLQMNRKGEDERIDDVKDINKFRPTRTGIKNAGAFLERCRYALSLFRPRYYAEEYIEYTALWEDMQDICQVSSLKQNQGKVGKLGDYLFNPDYMEMTPMEDTEIKDEVVESKADNSEN